MGAEQGWHGGWGPLLGSLTLAALCLGKVQAIVTRPAGITAVAPDVYFAATLPREEATGLICVSIT